jgi:cold shock CspA family protein
MQGMVAYGDLEYKIELIELLGKMLKQKGEELLSYQHFTLVCLIREENQWKLHGDILQIINSYLNMPVYKISEKPGLIKELSAFWNQDTPQPKRESAQAKSESGIQFKGIVKKMLKPTEIGKQGFITKDTGGDLFFFLKKEHVLYDDIREGMKVSFQSEPDKNGKGDRAIKIKAI